MPRAKKGKAAKQQNAANARHARLASEGEDSIVEGNTVDDIIEEDVAEPSQELDEETTTIDADTLNQWLDEVTGPDTLETMANNNAGAYLRTFYTGMLALRGLKFLFSVQYSFRSSSARQFKND